MLFKFPHQQRNDHSSKIVHDLRQKYSSPAETGVACIYYEYKQHDIQTPTNLLTGLWRQLVQEVSDMPEGLADLYSKHARSSTKVTLDEVTRLLRLKVRRLSRVFFVVDALNEYPEDGRVQKTLIAQLANILSKENSNKARPLLRVIITSRSPESTFPGANGIEIRVSDEDIRRVVSARIDNGIFRSKSVQRRLNGERGNSNKRRIMDLIVQNAEKM